MAVVIVLVTDAATLSPPYLLHCLASLDESGDQPNSFSLSINLNQFIYGETVQIKISNEMTKLAEHHTHTHTRTREKKMQ